MASAMASTMILVVWIMFFMFLVIYWLRAFNIFSFSSSDRFVELLCLDKASRVSSFSFSDTVSAFFVDSPSRICSFSSSVNTRGLSVVFSCAIGVPTVILLA